MDRDTEIQQLKEEILSLKKTVMDLKGVITDLKSQVIEKEPQRPSPEVGRYDMFPNQDCIERDASWDRLLNFLYDAEKGLTTTELAQQWGRSRSRTSEVLNQLVEEGHLVKYRDGRRMKFRAIED
ncbi:MAG: MarR family transcriptional regulator [Candidatus Lokiarchaeota archaeon]|nr:MarR family transcriptional regulator [Candidatus Lokiarchaeota archaeon]